MKPTDDVGRTPLHIAAQHNKLTMMKQLVNSGCCVDDKTNKGKTVFHIASQKGSEECLRFLCETYSHLVNVKDNIGWTAVHCAARYNEFNCLKILCEYADINIKTNKGVTALHVASWKASEDCFKVFV